MSLWSTSFYILIMATFIKIFNWHFRQIEEGIFVNNVVFPRIFEHLKSLVFVIYLYLSGNFLCVKF